MLCSKMKKLLIMYDIDGVKANLIKPLFKFINTTEGTNFEVSDVDSWNFELKSPKIIEKAEKAGLEPGWFNRKLRKFVEKHYLSSLPVIPGAQDSARYFADKGYKLSSITDRINSIKKEEFSNYDELLEQRRLEHQVVEDTLVWYSLIFGSSYFPQSRIFFADGESKAEIIKRLSNDYKYIFLIEDNYRNAKENALLSENNYSFLLNRRRYNQGEDIDRVKRIYGKEREKVDPESQFEELIIEVEKLNRQLTP